MTISLTVIVLLKTMIITTIIYFLVYYNVLWEVIKAQHPVGFVGCFKDYYGDSLVKGYNLYHSKSNKGDHCKAGCKKFKNRYAGTMGWSCYCGNDIDMNRERNTTECEKSCPGNASEQCGGYYSREYHVYLRITIYDTWPCITSPCQNGATCTDINAESYMCACTPGWTGHNCNAQPSENKLAIFIAVPVSIVVIIVFVLTVAVLILRKRKNRNQNMDGHSIICQTSLNNVNKSFATTNNAYNENDLIPTETPINVDGTKGNKANATTGESDNSFSTIDKHSGLEWASVDVYDYGDLNVTSASSCDPTYSHLSGSCDTSDYTYSHMNQSAGKLNQEVMSNVDHDRYNTCNMNSHTGKLRPAIKMNDTDDTYNKLGFNGKTVSVCEKNTLSRLNDPDYEHTDVMMNQ